MIDLFTLAAIFFVLYQASRLVDKYDKAGKVDKWLRDFIGL